MKIYETSTAPSPRRVRIFLAEKNIPMNYVQVDIAGGENLSDVLRAKNPMAKIPILELDDGTCISETISICRYFETLQPEPVLFGCGALQIAQIDMWQRFVELHLFSNVGMCFQHTTGYFSDRMKPNQEYGLEAGVQATKFLDILDKQLSQYQYVAGDAFSVADITALCALDFARVVNIRLADNHVHLKRWYALVNQRPSSKA
ncbi:glutathione S-transferase family protein [Paraglaciecola hydrolytica]|uniref:Glutathione S-transferase n=1 Tax=Paraglaciecola hydrolytica TaxID=1799789 RepID=A0A136A4S2_9ALTE|nr:glutathione S-transferase family protein [Paraglaciecola hydrolytica]KXI30248.1 glutathione S-transferase [Paraglaciecola hydrolytica]